MGPVVSPVKVIRRPGGKGTLQTRKVIAISSKARTRTLFAVVLAIGAFAALPALAGAQTISPTSDQYNNVLQQVSRGGTPPPPSSCADQSASGSGSASGSASNSCAPAPEAGGLPFTGLDVAALGGVAAFLLLAGLGLRRARFGERNAA
jgi:hypothetical protein